jgi:hypothetical protein
MPSSFPTARQWLSAIEPDDHAFDVLIWASARGLDELHAIGQLQEGTSQSALCDAAPDELWRWGEAIEPSQCIRGMCPQCIRAIRRVWFDKELCAEFKIDRAALGEFVSPSWNAVPVRCEIPVHVWAELEARR